MGYIRTCWRSLQFAFGLVYKLCLTYKLSFSVENMGKKGNAARRAPRAYTKRAPTKSQLRIYTIYILYTTTTAYMAVMVMAVGFLDPLGLGLYSILLYMYIRIQ